MGCKAAQRRLGTRNGYHLVRCSGCRHVFTANLPSDQTLAEHYRRYSYDNHGLASISPFIFQRLDEIMAPFDRYRRLNRLLDVGFGAGAALTVAKRRGWQVHGIERSTLAVDQAKANGFDDVLVADLEDAPYADGHFDVVMMVELIEHLPDARRFLRLGRRLLREGGLLFLTTPNGSGISGRLLATEWSVAMPPEHLHLFSPRSLQQALEASGFEAVKVWTEGMNPYEITRFLKRRFSAPSGNGDASQAYPAVNSVKLNERLSGSRWGKVAKQSVNRMLRWLHLGDAMKAMAEKATTKTTAA